jgi:replicative DNA helicase
VSANTVEYLLEERGLPADIPAEKAILGAVLLNNELLAEVEDSLQASDFFLDAHRRILRSMVNLARQGMAIDPVTLGADLRAQNYFEQVGGLTYLASLDDGLPRMDRIDYYACIVKQKAKRRRLVMAAADVFNKAIDEVDDETTAAAVERLVTEMPNSADELCGIYSSLDEFFCADICEPERILVGLHRGEVAGLFAVTNFGKSTLLLNVALSAAAGQVCSPLAPTASKPLHVLYIDCESPAARLRADIQTMLSNLADARTARENFSVIVISDSPLNLSRPDHLKHITKLAKAFGADLVILDTAASAFEFQDENNNAEVARRVMKPLKRLAREADCAVIFSHHIGKTNETQTGESAYRGRGASAFGALSRTVFTLERDAKKGPEYTILSCAKIKGQSFEPTLMKLNHEMRWFELCAEKPETKRQPPTAQEIANFVAQRGEARSAEIKKHFAGRGSERTIDDRIQEAMELGLIEKPNQQAPWRVCNDKCELFEMTPQTTEELTTSEGSQVRNSYKELQTANSKLNEGVSVEMAQCSCGSKGLPNRLCERCGEFLR